MNVRRLRTPGPVVGDHGLAAAGIAGNAGIGDGKVVRHQAGGDERPEGGDQAERPAAGIGDETGLGDAPGLLAVHLGKAVDPARRDAMGGRGVDDAGMGVLDQRDAFPRRLVGQAEDGDVGGVERLLAGGQLLAALRGQRNQREVGPGAEAFPDFNAGGAGFAVDEDFRGHRSNPLAARGGLHPNGTPVMSARADAICCRERK